MVAETIRWTSRHSRGPRAVAAAEGVARETSRRTCATTAASPVTASQKAGSSSTTKSGSALCQTRLECPRTSRSIPATGSAPEVRSEGGRQQLADHSAGGLGPVQRAQGGRGRLHFCAHRLGHVRGKRWRQLWCTPGGLQRAPLGQLHGSLGVPGVVRAGGAISAVARGSPVRNTSDSRPCAFIRQAATQT